MISLNCAPNEQEALGGQKNEFVNKKTQTKICQGGCRTIRDLSHCKAGAAMVLPLEPEITVSQPRWADLLTEANSFGQIHRYKIQIWPYTWLVEASALFRSCSCFTVVLCRQLQILPKERKGEENCIFCSP